MAILRGATGAYASVRVAVYEPLVVEWCSVPGLSNVLVNVLNRAVPERTKDVAGGAAAPTIARFLWQVAPPSTARRVLAAGTAPAAHVRPSARSLAVSPEEANRRGEVVRKLLALEHAALDEIVQTLTSARLPHLLTMGGLRQALSPIGTMHLYRQLYFDAGACIGPFEHAFTIAPKEELEIVQENVRRDSSERTEMFGSETTQEKTAEETATDEISDQVQSSLRRDMQLGVSASAQGSVGVWSASAQGSFDLTTSSERSREIATSRSIAQTTRASEILKKSYSLSVRSTAELAERRSVRRTITNDGAEPVNYGLRRVLRNIRVKLQSLGSRLVWQLYVERPGVHLAQSRMVMFRDADAIAPGQAPNAPPRPQGGTETGDATVAVLSDAGGAHIELAIPRDPMRRHRALTIDSISDAAPEKDARPPGILDAVSVGEEVGDVATRYTFRVSGGAKLVTVTYTLAYEPSQDAMEIWNEQCRAAQAAWEAQQLEAAFERAKRLIEAKSRVAPRPAADLRDEERYELLNRMVSLAFHDLPHDALPAPVELELFNRYFEVAAMFHFVHPAWWRPRYGAARDEYEVTDESEPATFGKSLGWLIQLDGDRRRNEFLNSPWVRVCVPIRPGVEREALDWLSQHIEGRVGFSTAEGSPVAGLLAEVEERRRLEQRALPGPDFVTADGTVAPGREDAADAYPVVDEFEVTVPTEGFIYERISTE